MNILDIVIIAILAYALYSGVKDGIVVQLCTLAGIALGLYLGSNYSDVAIKMLGLKGEYSSLWGFAIVAVGSIVAVSIAAYVFRQILRVAGLGIVDTILGAALSVCKYLLILSILFTIFDGLNSAYGIMGKGDLEQSKLFYPIAHLTEWITPAWDWTQDQIGNINI